MKVLKPEKQPALGLRGGLALQQHQMFGFAARARAFPQHRVFRAGLLRIVLRENIAAAAGFGLIRQCGILLPCVPCFKVLRRNRHTFFERGNALQHGGLALPKLLDGRAVRFGGVYPRQKQGHEQCPHQRDAGRPVGDGLTAADAFARNGHQPHNGEQQRHGHVRSVGGRRVIRAEINGAGSELGRNAVIHGNETHPQKQGRRTEHGTAEPVEERRRSAPQTVELRRAQQGQRRQHQHQQVLVALRIAGQKQPEQNQIAQYPRLHAAAALVLAGQRPHRQRPGGEGKPKAVRGVIAQLKSSLHLPRAAVAAEQMLLQIHGKFGRRG